MSLKTPKIYLILWMPSHLLVLLVAGLGCACPCHLTCRIGPLLAPRCCGPKQAWLLVGLVRKGSSHETATASTRSPLIPDPIKGQRGERRQELSPCRWWWHSFPFYPFSKAQGLGTGQAWFCCPVAHRAFTMVQCHTCVIEIITEHSESNTVSRDMTDSSPVTLSVHAVVDINSFFWHAV